MNKISWPLDMEGHFTITETKRTRDADLGPCTGYRIEELGVWIWLYDADTTRVSFDPDT